MRSKLAFIINEYAFFKSHRYHLINLLSSYYDVEIITDLSALKDLKTDIGTNSNIKFTHSSKRTPSINPLKFFTFIQQLKNKIDRIDPDYIFFVSFENCFIGAILSKYIDTKNNFFLVTGLGSFFNTNSFKGKLKKLLYKIVFQFLLSPKNKFVFQNIDDRTDLKLFITNNQIKSSIIEGNGIDTNKLRFHERFMKNLNQEIKFLLASKLQKEKGILEFINASKVLKKRYPETSFYIAGEFDPTNKLSIERSEFNAMRECKEINYLGFIQNNEMPALFKEYDVFILPSYREGLPSVALEAAATGMPLIMSNVPGCKSIIENNKNGYLIEPKSKSSIIVAVEKIINNKEKLEYFSHRSRAIVEERFKIEKILTQYLDLINS